MSSAVSPLILSAELPGLRARFCWWRNQPGTAPEVALFRRTFEVSAVPASLRIAVTADSRYILWVNGVRIGRGPLKGTLNDYQVETYELAPYLRAGANVLAAEVRWAGDDQAALGEVHSPWPGWWVQGLERDDLDTPGRWRVWADDSVRPNLEDSFTAARQYLGALDRVEPARRPSGWRQSGFDDATWMAAVAAGPGAGTEGWGLVPLRRLAARELPALREDPPVPFAHLWHERRPATLPWSLPAGAGGELWLDAGAMTTSYPMLSFLGGQGREVRIIYAEAPGHWREVNGRRRWEKASRRDDLEQGELHGYHDVVVLPGDRHDFEPFHWRTFRYLRIEVAPGPEPLTLASAAHRFTAFPHAFDARFQCAQPGTDALWDISLRTLQLCAHETYEDCPYFEQLNYAADTRLQALCTQYLANDTRLARRCLALFRDSLGPEGLVAGRAPSRRRQLIPGFALHWVLMLRDHWEWCGPSEAGFVRSCLIAVDAVLGHFRARLTPAGFVGRVDDWAWVDIVPGWPRGVPPAVNAGTGSSYFTALLVCALDAAAVLHRAAGEPDDARRWSDLAERLREAIRTTAWSEEAGLYLEGPGRADDPPSQHTQVMAILAGAGDARQLGLAAERLATDDTLLPMSLSHRFHLARALEATGRYEVFFPRVLAPWPEMVATGLTTWLESAHVARSDCHAWSAWMVHDFFAAILGARPAAPGWTHIRLCPQTTATAWARGELRVPTGRLAIQWTRDASGRIEFQADAPDGVPVTVVLPGLTREFPTGGRITLTLPVPASAAPVQPVARA